MVPIILPYTEISSKWIKDWNVNGTAFLEEKNERISFLPWDVEGFFKQDVIAKFKCWIYQPHKINTFVSIKWH